MDRRAVRGWMAALKSTGSEMASLELYETTQLGKSRTCNLVPLALPPLPQDTPGLALPARAQAVT